MVAEWEKDLGPITSSPSQSSSLVPAPYFVQCVWKLWVMSSFTNSHCQTLLCSWPVAVSTRWAKGRGVINKGKRALKILSFSQGLLEIWTERAGVTSMPSYWNSHFLNSGRDRAVWKAASKYQGRIFPAHGQSSPEKAEYFQIAVKCGLYSLVLGVGWTGTLRRMDRGTMLSNTQSRAWALGTTRIVTFCLCPKGTKISSE